MTQSPFRSGPVPASMDEFEQQLSPPAPEPAASATPQHAAAPVPQTDEVRNPWIAQQQETPSWAPVPRPAAPAGPAPMLRERRLVPDSGARRLVHVLTGGLVNLGPSAVQVRERERMRRIQRPLRGAHVTTYLCLKGGIAKTSTCAGTALTAAAHRPEAVVAGDFNPDAGDLAERVLGREGLAGVNRLAEQVDRVHSIAELSRFLETEGRLTVLPGEPDPQLGESLSSHQFNAVIEVLSCYYSSIHVDAGTGITHPIMPGILARTDTLVVPAAYSITGAKRAADTLKWLRNNKFERLADSAIVALTAKDQVSRDVDKAAVRAQFDGASLVVVPQDPHLADGALVRLDRMQPGTREAFAEIAALIADRYRG